MYGWQDVIAVHKGLIWLNVEEKDAFFFFFQVRGQLFFRYKVYIG